MDMIGKKAKNCAELLAPAKINLTLEVLGKRDDGYHELRSIMHSVSVYDRITVEPNGTENISVFCSVPLPERNTARTAAELFRAHTGCSGVDIRIEKAIPSEAGMGGASADAAGVLRCMEQLFGRLPEVELYSIGKKVGADVPFCLLGGCALAEGIGEKLTKLERFEYPLLLVRGKAGISTGKLFSFIDEKPLSSDARINRADGFLADTAHPKLHNDLFPAAVSFAPEIEEYRQRLLSLGALDAMMTGSGSAVYGIFSDTESAKRAYEAFPDCEFRRVASTIPNVW